MSRQGIRKQTIDVNGLNIHYLVAGEGPSLVLLHGIGESALGWSWVLPDLARNYRVYAPDLPGFGDSDKPDVDYSPDFFIRFVAAFLDALEIERAVLVGNSYGGQIALRLAFSAPSRLIALCLISSAALGKAVNPGMAQLTLPGYGEMVVAWCRTPTGATLRVWSRSMSLFADPRLAPPEWIVDQVRLSQIPGFLEALVRCVRAQFDITGQREILLDRLPSLTTPTLIIWGTHDRIFPVSQAQDALGRLRHGHLVLIPGCGHLPQIECPDQLVAALRQFLLRERLAGDAG